MGEGVRSPADNTITLRCKRFLYDVERKKLKQ